MGRLANNVGPTVASGIRIPRPLIERVDRIVMRRGFPRHSILLHMIEEAVDRDEAAQRRLARDARPAMPAVDQMASAGLGVGA